MSDVITHQTIVAAHVAERGYRAGWTAPQFAARQVAKLQEELAEAARCFDFDAGADLTSSVQAHMNTAGVVARLMFDDHGAWSNVELLDLAELKRELADVQVVVFALAAVIGELDGQPFNVAQAALDKARADTGRGVRVDAH